jgi:hypothetical protein
MDYVLGITSAMHMYMMTNKWKYSGYFGILIQALWFWFAMSTNNYGLLISGVLFMIMHIRTVWIWHLKMLFVKGVDHD